MRGKRILCWAVLAGLLCGCAAPPAQSGRTPEEDSASLEEREQRPTMPEIEEYFPSAGGAERESYVLLEGSGTEVPVTVIRGAEAGPVVAVVAGVHGDEQAGWRAAELLKEADIRAGTLYILSPANPYGAEHDQRRTQDGMDLNRNFPGQAEGDDAQRLAHAIYQALGEWQPALILDLHEAVKPNTPRDALGNSLICCDLEETGNLVLELLTASEEGELCTSPLTLYGSPPSGSLNRTAWEGLGIPAITVETYREEPLEQRVRNQLDILRFVLEYYGLC